MAKALHLGLMLGVLILYGACNVFDPLYSDKTGDDFEKALANANAALKRNDYAAAVDLYTSAWNKRTNSSQARVGLSSAIIMRDITISDIPKILSAVFAIDVSVTNNAGEIDFMEGEYDSIYKDKMIEALSNAAWWRAPVNSIDPDTGEIKTNSEGIPKVCPEISDGVISPDNCNSLFNYVILKTAHIAFVAQKEFKVMADLSAHIDINKYHALNADAFDTDAIVDVAAIQAEIAGMLATNATPVAIQIYLDAEDTNRKNEFAALYSDCAAQFGEIQTAFDKISGMLTGNERNTSLSNLVGVMVAITNVVTHEGSDVSKDVRDNITDAVDDISLALHNLETSFTNEIQETINVIEDLLRNDEFKDWVEDDLEVFVLGQPFYIKRPWTNIMP